MSKFKLAAIVGPSGSGKDTLANLLVEQNPTLFHKAILSTTRPPREYEQNNVHYHFVTNADFFGLHSWSQNGFLYVQSFDVGPKITWFYGLNIKDLDPNKINICILTPAALQSGLWEQINLKIFYIKVADDKVRLLRQLNREDKPNCHEICRRFLSDEQDFQIMDKGYFDYITFSNNTTPADLRAMDLSEEILDNFD